MIGITGRRRKGAEIVGNLAVLADVDGAFFYEDYARGVYEAGGLPVYLPMEAQPEEYAAKLDGFVISGGPDIEAGRYGASKDPETGAPDLVRDELEDALLGAAFAQEVPVLGICRGLQMINVHAGGTLHQHLPEHAIHERGVAPTSHSVSISDESALRGLFGAELAVNSLHHQAIDRLGEGLVATAVADDGTIEAIEHQTLPVVAVQWHPEMLTTRPTDPLFAWLIDSAA